MSNGATNPTIEIVKAVLPVFTFLLGIGYGYFDKVRESRRKIANTRTILLKELTYNYQRLNEFWPPDDDYASTGPGWPSVLTTLFKEGFTTRVYTGYLGQLDTLTSKELDTVFDAYNTMFFGAEVAENLGRAQQNSSDRTSQVQLTTALITLAQSTLDKLEAAIETLPDGKEALNQLKPKRGAQLSMGLGLPRLHGLFAFKPQHLLSV